MSPESFSTWADLLPEALLLVSGQGTILTLNRGAKNLWGDREGMVGRRLAELDKGDPAALEQYLRACSRTREPLPGALLLACGAGEPVAYRCKGAVLAPHAQAAERRLLLRLVPRQRSPSEFAVLNEKINQLTREIVRRREVEVDLKAQREKLQITLDSIGDAVIVTDAQGQITSLNPVAGRLTGWGEEAIGQPLERVFRIINEKTRAPVEHPVAKVLSRGVIVGLANHTVLIARDGTERPIDDSAAPIKSNDGTILGVVLIFRDVTAARRAARSLRESNERLQLALYAGRMGTWEWHIRTHQVVWSPSLEAIHGLVPGTFPGTFTAFQEDIHPDDRERVLAAITQALEQRQEYHIEYRLVWSDGSIHWAEARGRLFYDETGEPVQMMGVCTDITEHKETEQRLKEQTRIAQTLNRIGHTLAAELDLDKLVQLITDESTVLVDAEIGAFFYKVIDDTGGMYRLHALSGIPQEAFDGSLFSCNTSLFDTTFQGEGAVRLDDITQDPRYESNSLRYDRPEERLPVRSYLAVPVSSRSGEILGGLFFGHSRPRVFEKADEQIMIGVAAQAAIAIDNARLYGEVREAARRKDEFLAMLAHELRNPLAPIRTGLDLLALEIGDNEIIGRMKAQVEHMVRLVDDLLDVSRIMQGKIELKKESIALVQVLNRAVETIRPLIDAQQHELTISLPEQPINLEADPVRLAQVISNLLHNAAKYTGKGGRIWLSAQQEGNIAVIRVRDNGLGIEPDLLPQVFELFTQSQRSIDRSQGGLGIGLTVARTLVEMHKGTITAHSPGEGWGSEFVVRIPVPSFEPPSTKPPQPEPTPNGGCILVVEDNPDVARIQQLLLSRLGPYQVYTAHDGPTALEAARAHRPDLILLDIGLPGMNGYEVARRLRHDPLFQQTLIVALSGYGQAEDRRRSKEAGFDEHLTKPPSLASLRALLSHPKLGVRTQ